MTLSNHRLLGLVVLAALFGAGHHIDHIVRGNHVGWPLTPEVTPFTISLLVYPLILGGLALEWRDRGGPSYWTFVTGSGFALVVWTHFGPYAAEPPADVIGPYDSQLVGLFALAWLLVFTVVLGIAVAYSIRCWWNSRSTTTGHPMTDGGSVSQSRPWNRRSVQRNTHLVLAGFLGVFLYSPLSDSSAFSLIVQVVVFPALTLSGILMWRGVQIRRWLRARREGTT